MTGDKCESRKWNQSYYSDVTWKLEFGMSEKWKILEKSSMSWNGAKQTEDTWYIGNKLEWQLIFSD